MSEALTILQELRRDHERVGAAATALHKTSLLLHGGTDPQTGEVHRGVDAEYQEAYDEELIALEERCLADERRLPPADIREARVTRAVRQKAPGLLDRHRALAADEKALRQTIASRKAAIGAAQSILRGERGE
jgi:hypothetical protein